MNWSRTLLLGTMTAAAATFAAPARAQQLSDARVRELIRQATEQLGQAPATAQAPAAPAATQPADNRPQVRLTLDDAVKTALDHNLDIAVQRLNPQIQDIAIATARSVYAP